METLRKKQRPHLDAFNSAVTKDAITASAILGWVIALVIVFHLVGCTIYASTSGATGKLMDGLNGMIAQGKAPPSHDAYFKNRIQQAREETRQKALPGFLDAIFAHPSATVVNEASNQEEK